MVSTLAMVFFGTVLQFQGATFQICDQNRNACAARWGPEYLPLMYGLAWPESDPKYVSAARAGQTWSSATSTFRTTAAPQALHGPFVARMHDGSLPSQFDGNPGVTTLTYPSKYRISGATTLFNSLWSFNFTGQMDQATRKADFETIALHEMGHWLWLGHDCWRPQTVMCADYQARRVLGPDDILGVRTIYPQSNGGGGTPYEV